MAFYFCLVTFLSWHIENNEKRLTLKIYSVLEILDSFKVMIWNAHLIFAKIPPRFEVKIHLKSYQCQASLWFAFDVKLWGFTWNPPHFQVDSTSNICKCHLFSDLTFHAGIHVLYTHTIDLNSINNESYLIYSDNESHS